MSHEAWNEKELVENRLIEQLVELGYTHLIGSELVNERLESDVLLKQRLEWAIIRLNPWINESNVTPVSYTHLDVYKRQPLLFIISPPK